MNLFLLLIIPVSIAAFLFSTNSLKQIRLLHSLNLSKISVKTAESFSGKHVIITGASSGLGMAIAIQFAHCNPRHLVLSGRNLEALEKTKLECQKVMNLNDCGLIHIVTCDLSDSESSEVFAKKATVACEGKVDILVLCGGISSRSSFLDTTSSVDELVMKTNFLSGTIITKSVVPIMLKNKKGASIVWISSIQGLIGTPMRTSYAASKFAVQGYCEALRAELSCNGVKVHCVSPGYIKTNLSRSAVRGDGSKYGKLDETTANGADANDVAVRILNVVGSGKLSDFVVAAGLPSRVAIVLKLIAPRILEKTLVNRFIKAFKGLEQS